MHCIENFFTALETLSWRFEFEDRCLLFKLNVLISQIRFQKRRKLNCRFRKPITMKQEDNPLVTKIKHEPQKGIYQ